MEPRERAASLIRRCQQIATSIYPLADHAGFRSGDGAVSGETADTAHELEGLNKRLWARFDELRHWCDKLAHAGGRPDEEIEALLSTRVKLDDAGFPIRHGLRSARSHIGLASLADKLTVEAENLLSATNRFDAACGRIADKVVKVTSLLSQIERDASIHGMQDNHELVRLRDQVRPVVDAALTDPLGQSDEPFDVLEAELTAFTGFINRLEALSTDYPERLAGLRGKVSELVTAERDETELFVLATAKIGNPTPSALVPLSADLSERVAAAEGLGAEGSWHVLLQQLDQLDGDIGQALRNSRDRARSSQALLDRRSELRGRFAAYARKAARVRVIENPNVERALQEAKHLLEVAPCDLPAATVALSTFQDAITIAATKETSG